MALIFLYTDFLMDMVNTFEDAMREEFLLLPFIKEISPNSSPTVIDFRKLNKGILGMFSSKYKN